MGAGSAGVGVAKQLLEYYTRRGLTEAEAKEKFYLVETLGVDKVKLFLCLGFGEATARVVLEELLCDANTSTAGSHEDKFLVFDGDIGQVDGSDVTVNVKMAL